MDTAERVTANIDGRTARRERGRDAVIEATLRLLGGTEMPTAQELAEEAGVSTSSLFRYFKGLDDVYQEAADRFYEDHMELFDSAPEPGALLESRIVEYVELRVAIVVLMRPLLPLAKTQTRESPKLKPLFDRFRLEISSQFFRYFEPELEALTPAKRIDLVAALDAATSVDSAEMIIEVYDRSLPQIRRAWISLLSSVFSVGEAELPS